MLHQDWGPRARTGGLIIIIIIIIMIIYYLYYCIVLLLLSYYYDRWGQDSLGYSYSPGHQQQEQGNITMQVS